MRVQVASVIFSSSSLLLSLEHSCTFLCAIQFKSEWSWSRNFMTTPQASMKWRQVWQFQCDCDNIVHQPFRFHSSSQSMRPLQLSCSVQPTLIREALIHTKCDKFYLYILYPRNDILINRHYRYIFEMWNFRVRKRIHRVWIVSNWKSSENPNNISLEHWKINTHTYTQSQPFAAIRTISFHCTAS